MNEFLTTHWWLPVASIEILFRIASGGRWRPSVLIGTFLYGTWLVIALAYTTVMDNIRADKLAQDAPAKKPVATTATSAATTYSLKPLEIVLGLNRRNRPIKVNFKKYHTLIAGVTGYGKTNIINNILVQLYGKGSIFSDNVDVYLFDLKGDHEEDYLNLWKPVVKQYYSISDDDGAKKAVESLIRIADVAHKGKKGNHILVIIDEVASLTAHVTDRQLGRSGEIALGRLGAKLRSRGTIIAATQYPKFDIIGRDISSNLDRKIGLGVDGPDQAKLIFRFTPPKDILPNKPGEFLLKEPGKNGLIKGKAYLVNVPGEIDAAVFNVLESLGKDDPRIEFMAKIVSGLEPGASLPGAKKVFEASKGNGTVYGQSVVLEHYRNFANAGIVAPPVKRGQPYKLKVTYAEAFVLLKEYIRQGSWESTPEAFVQNKEK